MAKVPPIQPPDQGGKFEPRAGGLGSPQAPFAGGASLGGGGGLAIPFTTFPGLLGIIMGMHPAAWGSHTPATQALFAQAGRKGGRRSAAKRRRARAAAPKRRRKTSRARKARLVKGSAAAKRYMAKIRRKRRR